MKRELRIDNSLRVDTKLVLLLIRSLWSATAWLSPKALPCIVNKDSVSCRSTQAGCRRKNERTARDGGAALGAAREHGNDKERLYPRPCWSWQDDVSTRAKQSWSYYCYRLLCMSPSAAVCVSAPELLSGQGRAYSWVNKTYMHAVGWLLIRSFACRDWQPFGQFGKLKWDHLAKTGRETSVPRLNVSHYPPPLDRHGKGY